MKILTLKSDFSGIKTIVFYEWKTFIPTNPEKITSKLKNSLVKEYSSKDVYYYSGEDSSDVLDFSEYDFKYNPEKDKFKGFIKANYLDQYSLNFAQQDGEYDQDLLLGLCENIFPQLSNDLKKSTDPKFFGILIDQSHNILYLDIPGKNENSNGIWKIELYEDYIKTNNSYNNSKYPFIPYELMSLCYPKDIKNIPISIITFGPESNHLNNLDDLDNLNNQNLSMYFNNSLEYYDKEFIRIDDLEWESLQREILSNKILRLVISPRTGVIGDLNLSYLAWKKSKDPNRNQNRFALRNDEFYSTRDHYHIKNFEENILKDPISGSILSTTKLDTNVRLPILNTKLSNLKMRFSPRKVYKEAETVLINDYLYSSLISGNLCENPKYSKFWKIIKKYDEGDEKYLTSYEDSLELLRNNLQQGNYYQIFIHSNNKRFGSLTPSGNLSYRVTNKPLIYITPNPGYLLNYIDVFVDGQKLRGQSAVFDLTTSSFVYTIPNSLEIKSQLEVKAYFSPQANQYTISGLKLVDSDHYGLFNGLGDMKRFNTLQELNSFIPQLSVRFETSKNEELSPEEKKDSKTSRDIILLPKDSSLYPLKMIIDDYYSPYEVITVESFVESGIIEKYFLKMDNESNLKYILFPTNLSLEFLFVVRSKLLNCRVLCDHRTDVSTEGSFVTHSSPFSVSFSKKEEERSVFILQISDDNMKTPIQFNPIEVGDIFYDNKKIGSIDYNNSIYKLDLDSICFDTTIKIQSSLDN